MFIKRFIGKDMQDAIKKIRKEFGVDAVIIDSKPIRKKGFKGWFQKKQVEVVAAYETKKKVEKSTAAEPVKMTEMPKNSTPRSEEIAELSHQISGLQDVIKNHLVSPIAERTTDFLKMPQKVQSIYERLVAEDIEEALARAIAGQALKISDKRQLDPETVTHELIVEKLGAQSPVKLKKFEQNVWMFVGPTGVGKTTTLAKLAGMFSLNKHLKVGLINMDTYRIGAKEHIKIYSDILGVPMLTAYNAKELKAAKKKFEDLDIILIDTAGRISNDAAYQAEMRELIDAADVDELFLVISMTTGLKACRDIVSSIAFYDSYKLALTKLDEVTTWGNVLNIAKLANKTPTYISNGQNVPDDIFEADIVKIADSICKLRC